MESYLEIRKLNVQLDNDCSVTSGVFYDGKNYLPYLVCNEYKSKIIEDINMTIERSEKSKKGKDPGPFLTSFTRDNNPNAIKNKIDINKTFNFGENHKNKLDDINLGESYQTIILNEDGNGNNILENSLNAKFGQIQKSEVIDPKKIQNLNQSNNGSIHVFNSMSQFSDNGDDNNINNSINSNNIQNLIGKNMDILNSSNVMIIGNKIDLKSNRVISRENGIAKARKMKMDKFAEVSAKTKENLDAVGQKLAIEANAVVLLEKRV